MTEFKKGDRVVFVKNDEYAGVEMPKGTLATYDDDGLSSAAPVVVLDTGERVRAWHDYIAPAGDHGTGDGSASDICAEPGCNCDLERRFPAPLDPSKVKAGDTVTVRVEEEYAHTTHPAYTISDTTAYGDPVMVGPFVLDQEHITLLDHQPAPGPEPEWTPGTVADIEVGGDMQYRAIRTDDHLWSTESHWSYEDAEVTDVRPLVVIDPAAADAFLATQPAPEPEPKWKPGTFVSGEFEGQRDQGVVTEQGDLLFWNHTGGHMQEEPLSTLTDVRPLVVIDPADVDVVALQREIDDAMPGHEASVALAHLGLTR